MNARWVRWVAYALVPVWLIGMVVAFWYFQTSKQRVYLAVNQPSTPLTIHTEHLTVAHLWDPDCICSRFNVTHVQDLIKEYQGKGVEFVIVPRLDSKSNIDKEMADIRKKFGNVRIEPGWYKKLSKYMPAVPSAAIFNKEGKVMYTGPYSASLFCTPSPDGFVEKVLNKMLANKAKKEFITPIVSGCFCPNKSGGVKNKI